MRKSLVSIVAALFIVGSWTAIAVSADPLPPQLPKKEMKQEAPPTEMMRATGIVQGYEKGKNIQVSSSGGGLRTFGIVSATKVSGKIEKGARVVVIYEKQQDALVANQITVGSR